MDLLDKIKLYIELSRQEGVIKEEIQKLRQELLPSFAPGEVKTVDMKAVKRMTMDRAYFDQSRFKQDNPSLYQKYVVYKSQDYLKIVDASDKFKKRKDL